jgi:hypothetical protein
MVDLDAALQEMRRLSGLIDQGVGAMREQARVYAQSEHDYRKAKAAAWIEAPRAAEDGSKITAGEREAWVHGVTASERKQRDIAEGMRQAALEAVRSRRTQLSAWQSYLAAGREEMGMGKYGPEMAP